eukprot:Gb_34405 [translate_table: standard]
MLELTSCGVDLEPYSLSPVDWLIWHRDSMTQEDLVATVSVLLGFAPFTSFSSVSSSKVVADKLDRLLLPDPFDRPHAVFMLEARGIDQGLDNISTELLSELDLMKLELDAYSYRQLVAESSHAAIELPEDEVILQSLTGASGVECDATCIEQELVDLSSWLGGSYVEEQQPLQGKLNIPLPKGSILTLDLLKRADQTFATELVSLLRNIRQAISLHEHLAESSHNPAELLMGSFRGVEALQEYYGKGVISLQGSELFLNVVAKLFHSLQLAYGGWYSEHLPEITVDLNVVNAAGQIVGVVAINSNAAPAFEGIFDVKLSLRPSRWLTEQGSPSTSNSTTYEEIKLVRRSLAWSTAIILLIATLIGVYYLFNMPLTRDTLLYSNAKLD